MTSILTCNLTHDVSTSENDVKGEFKRAERQSGCPNVTWHARRKCWYGRFIRGSKMQHVGYWKEGDLDTAIAETTRAVSEYDAAAKRKKRKT